MVRNCENQQIAARQEGPSDPLRIASFVAVAVALVFLVHEIVDIVLAFVTESNEFGYLYVVVGDEVITYDDALAWAITVVIAAGVAALMERLRARSR